MSSINKDVVKHIAKLARIDLDQEELGYYSAQLSQILEYVDKINSLDLKDVRPTLNPHLEENVYREDKVEPFVDIPLLFDVVPVKEGNFIKIPKVIE